MSPLNMDTPGNLYQEVPTSENKDEACDCTKETVNTEPRDSSNQVHQDDEKLVKSSETNSNDISSEAEVVVPPDGGWGWVIVAASFMCNLIIDGIIFSFGTFLMDIAEEFSVTKAEVTLVGSLMSGFYLIAGPFASAIANRYGFRLVAISGSVLASIGFVLSYFATSVTFLCISYGVIGGIGFGLMYVPSIITIGFYFERWRALATGIAVCGSGIGTFLFAPLSEFMITNLGWRAALFCQGGLVLSCVIYGALFRPLKPTKVDKLKEEDDKEEIIDTSCLPTQTKNKMEAALKILNDNPNYSQYHSSLPRVLAVNNNSEYPRVSDVYQHSSGIPNSKIDCFTKEKTLSVPFLVDHHKPKSEGKSHLLDIEKMKPLILPKRNRTISEATKEDHEVVRPLYKEDIFFAASLTRLPQYTSRTSVAYNLSITRLPTKNDIDEEKKGRCKLCPEAFKRVIATMLDFGLMKSASFIILAVGGFFTMMGFYVPYMYLVDRAKDSGIDKTTSVMLVSSIGIANTIGRVLCGVLSSLPGVNALFVTNVALTIGGVATMLSGFSMSNEYQFLYTIVFGLSISCFASLRSIVVVDLLGLEKLTNAFGLLLLFQGIAAIIGAPLAGAFMNATGSYDACFYLSGGVLTLSAILCYPLNCVNKWENRKKQDCEVQMEEV